MLKYLILLLVLSCSGDATVTDAQEDSLQFHAPPLVPWDASIITWEDASRQWAEGWCYNWERCDYKDFHNYTTNHNRCVDKVVLTLCVEYFWPTCPQLYPPARLEELNECKKDWEVIACWKTPDSCANVFDPLLHKLSEIDTVKDRIEDTIP